MFVIVCIFVFVVFFVVEGKFDFELKEWGLFCMCCCKIICDEVL